jgi:hypothetical protein
LIATTVEPARLATVRKAIRALVLPGQRRLHMKSESNPRRRQILSALREEGETTTIYRAGSNYKSDIDRRRACLDSMAADIARAGHSKLCLESDETMDERDRRDLVRLIKEHACPDLLYLHERAAQEPLLAISDVIGWAWARGGDWRRRALPLVETITDV